MQNNHGAIVRVDVSRFDESVGKYECFLTFEDSFEYDCFLTKQDIIRLQSDISSRINVAEEKDTLRKFSPLPRQQGTVGDFNNRIDQVARKAHDRSPPTSREELYDARENINSGKSIGYRMSLKEFAQQNPQRTKLLNGKLFTPDLIRKTERGGIPEAFQN